MKKIHVQKKISLLQLVFVIFILLVFCGGLIYILFTQNYISQKTSGDIYAFFGLAIFMISLCFKDFITNKEYVSDILITSDSLVLCYKNKNRGWQQVINITDIESVHADLSANYVQQGRYRMIECETSVYIKTKTKTVSFTQKPSSLTLKCPYTFMLNLLSVAPLLPGFSYQVNGNAEAIKEDIRHFEIYGKRMSFWQMRRAEIKNSSRISKISLGIAAICIILPVCMLIYLFFPPIVSPQDNTYKTYIENGYEYYRQDLYENALQEYDKALSIHDDDAVLYYYRALNYYENKQYQEAKDEALKGLNFVDKKSVYYKTKNYKFMDNNIGGIYTILAKSETKMGQFAEAKEAYTKIIDKIKYKYTDAYFKRGICEYKLGDKDAALNDFYRHKEIIEEYIAEEEASEYKSKYPTYTQDDIDNINLWIKSCDNL